MLQKESCFARKCLLVAFTFLNIKIVRGDFCLANISIVCGDFSLANISIVCGDFCLVNISIVCGDFCLANISIVRVFRSGYFKRQIWLRLILK
mgnify:CR=1 FL=1